VQVPFRVPRLDLPVEGFLPQLIPGWTNSLKLLPQNFAQTIHDVATLGLEANPRQIKRIITSVLVLMNVARGRDVAVDVRLLAALVGVQLRWPAEYRDFVEAVLADDENLLAVLTPTDQPKLQRYAEVFFQNNTSANAFRPYVQLAQTVAISEVEPKGESRSAADIREENRKILVKMLSEKGYQPGRTADTYSLERNPDFRIKIGKTVIRFEVKATGGRWILGPSCLLTTEHSRAMMLISDPHKVAQAIPKSRIGNGESYVSPAKLEKRNADVRAQDLNRP
jgi:hypothetical protein